METDYAEKEMSKKPCIRGLSLPVIYEHKKVSISNTVNIPVVYEQKTD